MLATIKRLLTSDRGNAALLLAFALGGMLIMAGVVIDSGNIYMQKSHLQKTANAAALSGAQELPNSNEAVRVVVDEIVESHDQSESIVDVTFQHGFEVKVDLIKEVNLFFASLLGMETVTIHVDATAGLYPVGAASGAVPLGINESVELVYGNTYQLKVDAGDSVSGNFGVLALEGPGAKLYRESLTYGFGEQLKVGDVLNTQSGNIAGATRDGVNYRINNCPYPDGEYHHRDCSRVMLVVVYKPKSVTNNKLNSVEITGFAYFYVTKPMSSNDDSIQGIFIKRAGAGSTGEKVPQDRGAYTIKLVD